MARIPCACQVLQLGASSGIPSSHGARPNPSLKRSANGSTPGPVSGAGAFSTARAWRATVVARLAHTLGVNQSQLWYVLVNHYLTKFRGTSKEPAHDHHDANPLRW